MATDAKQASRREIAERLLDHLDALSLPTVKLAAIEEALEAQAGYQRATIGLSNLYHVITNERCDDAVALGMATSAVGALLRERDELKDQLAQVTQERDNNRETLRQILKEAEFVGDAKQPFSTWVAEKIRRSNHEQP